MKKLSILAITLLAAGSAIAQQQVVKDVEHMLKESKPDYAAALKAIKPALSDPSTAGTITPWLLAGQAGFGQYDQVFLMESMGNGQNADVKDAAGKAMVDGFEAYMKALSLDSIPDEKGKIKPKKSKEILKAIAEQHPQLRNAGIFMFQAQDFDGALKAWELYTSLPTNPLLSKNPPKALPDTVLGDAYLLQSLAALSENKDAVALSALQKVPASFKNIDVYVYGVEAARRINDSTAMLDFATKGYELFGTENISFIGQLINAKLLAGDYKACHQLVEKAIAATPADNTQMQSQLYDILGYICEQENDMANAEKNYQKSIDLDPSYAKAYFDLGRVIYNTALKSDEQTEGKNIDALKNDFLRAAELFEKAYNLDETNMGSVPGILYRLFYRLGAGYENQTTQWKAEAGE